MNHHEYVIAYASRVLTKSEKKYSATRREMLALIWGIKHFRSYLYGQKFDARTDHNSLKCLHSFHEPEGRVARWLEVLSEYDFTIVHRPGAKHSYADALSRSNCSQHDTQDVQINQPIAALVTSLASDNWLGAKSADEIQAAQRADPNLLAVATWLEKGTIPSQFPKNCNQQLQALWNQRHHLLRDGIVYCQWRDVPGNGENQKLQLVVPKQWISDILTSLHDSSTAAHLGTRKTLERIRNRFYWVKQMLENGVQAVRNVHQESPRQRSPVLLCKLR